ncbi:MAG: flagellar hook-associated protein FlgL [Acidobacteria bacterium]|nr:flagellar hook-associated protein FlgL [Acidobacteriota bacterium]
MIGRVTTSTMATASARNLQAAQARLAQLQTNAQSLKRINRPSDDPAGTADSLQIRAQQTANAQYGRNIDNGDAWMNVTDGALGTATALLQRAKDLTLQGANGSQSTTSKTAIATELDGIRQDLLAAANTKYLGRNVFAGTSDQAAAYVDGTPPAYTGIAGSSVDRRVGASTTIRVDSDGSAIFGTGSTSVFSLLSTVADNLRNGVDVSAQITDLGNSLNSIINGRSELGARQSQLEAVKTTIQNDGVALETQRSNAEDIDLSKAILDLQTQQLTYTSSLAITAKVLQPTLMDYLR